MANVIHEIENIDEEMKRLRERRKAKVEKAFDDSVWELLTALGYEGSRSKAQALPELLRIIEQVEQEAENASSPSQTVVY